MNKVFVYGTLKSGFRLHHLLNGAAFIGSDVVDGYTLFDSGYGYPIAAKATSEFVSGEVYSVTDSVLNTLDMVEIPSGYIRREVKLDSGGKAFMYYRDTAYNCMIMCRGTKR